jgi:predicted helicase
MRYQFDKFFPTPDTKNLVICVSGIGVTKDFSCLISDRLTDLEFVGKSQCFPLYYYEKASNADGELFETSPPSHANAPPAPTGYIRKDGVSDHILNKVRDKYGKNGRLHYTKEDIFYYVYALLHHPKYRATFADDLKRSLPRIPLVDSSDDFRAFIKAGRDLAALHLDYEDSYNDLVAARNKRGIHFDNCNAYTSIMVDQNPTAPKDEFEDYCVTKMRIYRHEFLLENASAESRVLHSHGNPEGTGGFRDITYDIIYNKNNRITWIPEEAFRYIVNGKSAIEWVIERYQVKTDKDSGIKNDPNDYAKEIGKPDYIFKLLLSVIALSIKTVGIVDGLPELQL